MLISVHLRETSHVGLKILKFTEVVMHEFIKINMTLQSHLEVWN